MGEIVAAAVVGHQPAIMLPPEVRKSMGAGRDTTLVDPGMENLRAMLERARANTLVIFDTHWFTTIEHIVAGAAHHRGTYTSDELPTIIADHAYDYPGAPALAEAIAKAAEGSPERVLDATNPHMVKHYPTLNLVHYLQRDEAVLSVSTLQSAEGHNYLRFGEVIAAGIAATEGVRAALLGSGGMSHRFWPIDQMMGHATFKPEDVVSPEARAIDERIIRLWEKGDHAAVIDLYPEYRGFQPEGFFSHYLTPIGALGGRDCKAPGTRLSDYENAVGTGQVHVCFDLGGSR